MGVKGLLPFLKNCSKPVNIRSLKGYTVAIDAYCWLHRASHGCAMELGLGSHTNQYVEYCMKFLQMILAAQIKPILVFDGANLPAKAGTDANRRSVKKTYKEKALQYLKEGNRKAAQECFERCIDVTPDMARAVIKAARKRGVDCIVAPYESDAQLAHLIRAGYADLVITEDSDLLMFGCTQVVFKLDLSGNGVLITWSAGFGETCCGISSENFVPETLRYMGILAGCDYFPGVPRIGLTTAAKIMRQWRRTIFRDLLENLGQYFNLPEIDEYWNKNEAQTMDNTTDGIESDGDSNCTYLSASSSLKRFPGNPREVGRRRVSASAHRLESSCRSLPTSMITAAVRAERTFRLQAVYDPKQRKRIRLMEPTPCDIADEKLMMLTSEDEGFEQNSSCFFAYAGDVSIDPDIAFGMAIGNIDFYSGKTVDDFNPNNLFLKKPCDACLLNTTEDCTEVEKLRPMCISKSSPHLPPLVTLPFGGSTGRGFSFKYVVRPKHSRMHCSIWSKDYELEPVWLHFSSDSGRPKLRCATVKPNGDNESFTEMDMFSFDFCAPTLSTSDCVPPSPTLPKSSPAIRCVANQSFRTADKNNRVSYPRMRFSEQRSVTNFKQPLKQPASEAIDILSQSAKISEVLQSYTMTTQSTPLASHGTRDTPVVSASPYFSSPVLAACRVPETPVPPVNSARSPIFRQKLIVTTKSPAEPSVTVERPLQVLRSVNRFAVANQAPKSDGDSNDILPVGRKPGCVVSPRIPLSEMQNKLLTSFQCSSRKRPRTVTSLVTGPSQTALPSFESSSSQTANLFAVVTSPAEDQPRSPIYSLNEGLAFTEHENTLVGHFEKQGTHSTKLTMVANENASEVGLSTQFSKWQFKSSKHASF